MFCHPTLNEKHFASHDYENGVEWYQDHLQTAVERVSTALGKMLLSSTE
jgi:hypothetical protein